MGIIYKIVCKKNGKSYVGKTERSFEERYSSGRFWAETHNRELQDDAYLHGADNMEIRILAESAYLSGKELTELEDWFIDRHNTLAPSGYNKRKNITSQTIDIASIENSRLREMLDTSAKALGSWERAHALNETSIVQLEELLNTFRSFLDETVPMMIFNGEIYRHRLWFAVQSVAKPDFFGLSKEFEDFIASAENPTQAYHAYMYVGSAYAFFNSDTFAREMKETFANFSTADHVEQFKNMTLAQVKSLRERIGDMLERHPKIDGLVKAFLNFERERA